MMTCLDFLAQIKLGSEELAASHARVAERHLVLRQSAGLVRENMLNL